MFKSIKYLRYENEKWIYQLTDSDFTCVVLVVVVSLMPLVPLVAAEYKKRNLPIVSNIVLLYLSYHKQGYNSMNDIQRWVIEGQPIIDKYYPELEYEKLYYPEIKSQIEKLSLLES